MTAITWLPCVNICYTDHGWKTRDIPHVVITSHSAIIMSSRTITTYVEKWFRTQSFFPKSIRNHLNSGTHVSNVIECISCRYFLYVAHLLCIQNLLIQLNHLSNWQKTHSYLNDIYIMFQYKNLKNFINNWLTAKI